MLFGKKIKIKIPVFKLEPDLQAIWALEIDWRVSIHRRAFFFVWIQVLGFTLIMDQTKVQAQRILRIEDFRSFLWETSQEREGRRTFRQGIATLFGFFSIRSKTRIREQIFGAVTLSVSLRLQSCIRN